ncbi:MAG: excisionase [Rubrivivax sp.]|mgnify:CR=1 FL=1
MTAPAPVVIQVALAPRVLKAQFAAATGLTVKAIERKIEDGKWLEGKQYHKDPDGRVWIDVKGAMEWIAPT